MNCPNCQFEIQAGVSNCPFCNFVIEGGGIAETVGTPEAPGSPEIEETGTVPVPGGEAPPVEAIPTTDWQDPLAGSGDIQDLGDGSIEPQMTPIVEDSSAPPAGAFPDEDITAVAPPKKSKLSILAPLAIALAAGYGVWMIIQPKPAPADGFLAAPAPSSAEPVPGIPDPAPSAPAEDEIRAEAGPATPAPEPVSHAGRDAALADPRLAEMLKNQGSEPNNSAGLADEPAPAQERPWTFEGVVYDLITLEPVAGAEILLFDDGGGRDFATASNSKGLYRITVPGLANGGYRLMIDHNAYLADYFDEGRPPFRSMKRAQRLRMRSVKPMHPPWQGRSGEKTRRNIVLFPDITDDY